MTALYILGACIGATVLFVVCAAGAWVILDALDDLIPLAVALVLGWAAFTLFGIPLIVLNLMGQFP